MTRTAITSTDCPFCKHPLIDHHVDQDMRIGNCRVCSCPGRFTRTVTALDVITFLLGAISESHLQTATTPLEPGTDRDTWHFVSDGSRIPPCHVTIRALPFDEAVSDGE